MKQQQSIEQPQLVVEHLELSKLKSSPTNPRKIFDQESLHELAQSIISKGVLQPIIVRKIQGNGSYEVVVGERRFRASKAAQVAKESITTIPAFVRDLSDEEVIELQIIENLQRKDIHPMEEAAGFKQLMDVKKFDITEIGRRLGKTPHYVAQRLKLNELIPEWQKEFFKGKIWMKDCLRICTLSKIDQKELWKEEGEGYNGTDVIELSDWDYKKYTNRLADAPFDITDPNLKKDMGACTNCPYNSAVNTLLFPDQANNPTCLNSQCFQQKCNLSYDKELKAAIETPEVLLVQDYGGQGGKEVQQAQKMGGTVIARSEIHEIDKPDYEEDVIESTDRDDYDNEKEWKEDRDRAEKEYQKELAEYNKKIESGKFRKAYMVNGNDKGKYIFVELRRKGSSTPSVATSSTVVKDKISSGEASKEDIQTEISRIQERERRSKQLDEEKIWSQLVKEFKPGNKMPILAGKFTQVEREAIATVIDNKLRMSDSSAFKKIFPKDFSKVTDDILFRMLRFFFLSVLPPEVLYSGYTSDARVCLKVAAAYIPKTLKTVQDAQNAVTKKRQERVNIRLGQLRAMLKEKSSPKKATGGKKR